MDGYTKTKITTYRY